MVLVNPSLFIAIFSAMIEIAHLLETRKIPGIFDELFKEIEASEIFRIAKSEMSAMFEGYPEEYEAVKHIASRTMATLNEDADKLYKSIMEMPAVQRIADWIVNETIMVQTATKLIHHHKLGIRRSMIWNILHLITAHRINTILFFSDV